MTAAIRSLWTPVVSPSERQKLQIPRGQTALTVRWINTKELGGQAVHESGLREGDIIVALENKPLQMNANQFHVHIKLNYRVGDVLPIEVLRGGKRLELKLRLAE